MVHDSLEQDQWLHLLEQAQKIPPTTLRAIEFRRQWRTKSQPFLLECEDEYDYVVKTLEHGGRQLINDQLVARLGMLLQAPVGKPELIDLPAELLEMEARLGGIAPRLAHGCQWIPNCFDEWTLIATGEQENRLRLVLLATLYGWAIASDHQFLFNRYPPRLIHSVDHGHFFPNPPNWTIPALEGVPRAELDAFFQDCAFTPDELSKAKEHLQAISLEQIIQTVAVIPEDWAFTMEERIAMVRFLVTRQKEILEGLATVSEA